MGEIGGSSPPGTTATKLGGLPDWGRGPVGSRLSTHTALRVRLPLLPLDRLLQGRAPGRAGGLQNRGTGFESLRSYFRRRGSTQKGTGLVSRPMLVRNQSSALLNGLP